MSAGCGPFGGAVKPLRRGKERGGPLCFRGPSENDSFSRAGFFPGSRPGDSPRRVSARARPRLLYQIMFEMRAVHSRHLSSFVFLRRFAGLLFFAALRRIHLDASPRTLRPCFYFGLVLFPRVENEWCHVGNEWCPTGAAHFFPRRGCLSTRVEKAHAAPGAGCAAPRSVDVAGINRWAFEWSRPPGSRFEPFLFSARRRGCQRRAGQRAARAAQNFSKKPSTTQHRSTHT